MFGICCGFRNVFYEGGFDFVVEFFFDGFVVFVMCEGLVGVVYWVDVDEGDF